MKKLLEKRAAVIGEVLLPYLEAGANILDFGCADMAIPTYISGKLEVSFTGVDVQNYSTGDFKFVKISEGQPLPFEAGQFDIVVAGFALHHCDDPDYYFSELYRVAGNKIILLEDTYSTWIGKIRTSVMDRLLNSNFVIKNEGGKDRNIPYNYKSKKQWRQVARDYNLTIKDFKRFYAFPIPFVPGHQVLIALEKF